MYLDNSIQVYQRDLSSSKPIPGGGSAAALVGALGAALLSKVANFTIGKEKYKAVESQIKKVLDSTEKSRSELEKLVDEDTLAYQKVADARCLPKDTDEQKRIRTFALQDALKQALVIPLAVCRLSSEAIKLCPVLLEKGNVNLSSDVGVAAEFFNCAFLSAKLNVEINLSAIKDHSLIEKVNRELAIKEKEIFSMKEEIVKKTKGLF